MFRFDKVTYLYNLEAYTDGRILEISTDEGYATVDKKRLHYWSMKRNNYKVLQIPTYYIRKEDTLYLMEEEPQFYA